MYTVIQSGLYYSNKLGRDPVYVIAAEKITEDHCSTNENGANNTYFYKFFNSNVIGTCKQWWLVNDYRISLSIIPVLGDPVTDQWSKACDARLNGYQLPN